MWLRGACAGRVVTAGGDGEAAAGPPRDALRAGAQAEAGLQAPLLHVRLAVRHDLRRGGSAPGWLRGCIWRVGAGVLCVLCAPDVDGRTGVVGDREAADSQLRVKHGAGDAAGGERLAGVAGAADPHPRHR